jgi:adenosylcobinamide kinase / adenosylcobinamide-phosphate guanylyltransferase
MAAEIILVTGAARAGKSRYAEGRATELGARRLYIATAEPNDEEMRRRIEEHKTRRGDDWATVEEPLQLAETLLEQRRQTDCALVDCLTLWLSNLVLRYGVDYAQEKVEQFVQTTRQLDFHLILVTNEVGWGIVPDNSLGRQFRDLSGLANQRIAAAANEVVLIVAGIPMIVKKGIV